MEPTRQLEAIVPALEATVDRIQGMQMNDPTPCSEFTVHDVLNHMIVLGGTFSYMFRGEEPPHLTPPPVYGWVPKQEFCEVMDDLLDAVRSPGAMERPIASPVGEVPGDTFARFVAVDGLLHGWDLATATGTTFEIPDDVVAEVERFASTAITPEMRDAGMFAAPTAAPPDATPLERLVAFSGRTP
jgi:uncharacterized protein (TIGR03086 family)